MPPKTTQRELIVYTVILLIVLGVIGMRIIMLLVGTWRRFNERNAAGKSDAAKGRTQRSAWEVTAERAEERGDEGDDQGDASAGRG